MTAPSALVGTGIGTAGENFVGQLEMDETEEDRK